MKQVKHILIFIFTIAVAFVCMKKISAESVTCYYMSDELEAWVTFTGSGAMPTSGKVTTKKYGNSNVKETASIKNINNSDDCWDPFDGDDDLCVDDIDQYDFMYFAALKSDWQNCPEYLWMWKQKSNAIVTNWYGDIRRIYRNAEGNAEGESKEAKRVSPDTFWELNQCNPEDDECIVGEDIKLVCDFNKDGTRDADGIKQVSLFGDPNHRGNGTDEDPPSTAYLIKQAMNILRIAGVAIAITLGTVDIAKAVIASKEDEMKKAQKTFVKRIIACVVIFLVPTFINIVIKMSYTSWQNQYYQACTVEEIGLSSN